MSELRTDEEQAEIVKKWWSENGTSIVASVAVVGAGWFGWTSYQDSVQQTGEAASLVFNQLTEKVALPATEQTAAIKDEIQAFTEQLKTEYSSTAYADYGRLFSARFAADAGNYEAAAEELEQIVATTDAGPIQYTAQARLAKIYVQLERFDDALALTDTVPDATYAAQFEEVRGDALYRKEDFSGARAAYVRAVQAAQTIGLNDPGLQRKVDALVAIIAEQEPSDNANEAAADAS